MRIKAFSKMSVSVFRPLCEVRSNEVWQLTFHKIATRSAVRSTLKTSTTFCVKKAPMRRVLWYFMPAQKVHNNNDKRRMYI